MIVYLPATDKDQCSHNNIEQLFVRSAAQALSAKTLVLAEY